MQVWNSLWFGLFIQSSVNSNRLDLYWWKKCRFCLTVMSQRRSSVTKSVCMCVCVCVGGGAQTHLCPLIWECGARVPAALLLRPWSNTHLTKNRFHTCIATRVKGSTKSINYKSLTVAEWSERHAGTRWFDSRRRHIFSFWIFHCYTPIK